MAETMQNYKLEKIRNGLPFVSSPFTECVLHRTTGSAVKAGLFWAPINETQSNSRFAQLNDKVTNE
jgi:hypothetical protein